MGTPAPTPTPSGLDCSALLSDDEASALIGSTIGAVDPNLAAAAPTTYGWLSGYEIEAVQGAHCVWGEPGMEWTGAYDARGKPALVLQALPHAQGAWAVLRPESGTAGAAYDGGESFGGSCADGQCHTDVLVGNWWLSADASSPKVTMTERAFHEQVQKAVSVLRAHPEPPAVSVHNAITDACRADAFMTAVKQSFDAPQASLHERQFGFAIESALRIATATAGCSYQPAGGVANSLLMSAWVIPDGKRLFGELAQIAGQSSTVTEFGRMIGAYDNENSAFEFNSLVGKDWVTIYVYRPGPDAQRQSKAFVDWLRTAYA